MTLAEHRGKWLVLFFYPRDFTFIYPTELIAFGELEADFERLLSNSPLRRQVPVPRP
jgi:alkyl hydroperoxide reductase subunit AhpC